MTKDGAMVEPLVLTDDEVVTVSLLYRQAWPVPVPTVDLADSAAVQAAVERGRRSLVARGFMRETAEGAMLRADVENVVEAALDGAPELIVAVVGEDLQAVPDGVWMSSVAGDGAAERLQVAVGPEGMHVLERTDPESLRDLVAGLLMEAVTQGVTGGERSDVCLSVNRRSGGGSRTLLARRGEASVVEGGGRVSAPSDGTLRTVLDAFWSDGT